MIRTGRREDHLHYLCDLIDAPFGLFEAQHLSHRGNVFGGGQVWRDKGDTVSVLGRPKHQQPELLRGGCGGGISEHSPGQPTAKGVAFVKGAHPRSES